MNNKAALVIMILLLAQAIFAQTRVERMIPIDSIFALLERNNTQLKMANATVESAQKFVLVTKNEQLPSLDLGLSASYLGNGTLLDRDFSNAQNAPMPHFGNSFSVEASYLVFAGGAISNAIDKAELEAQTANLAQHITRMDMRILALASYLDLCKLQNQRKIFLKNMEQTEVLIKQIAAKQTEGMALANDLTRYEMMRQNLNLSLVEIENNISIINQQLVITLGLPQETEIQADSTIQSMQMQPISQEDLETIAEINRPELRQAALQTTIAEKQVKLAQAANYPSVAIFAGDHLDGPITIEVPAIDKNYNGWYVGIGLKYNLASLYKSKEAVLLATSNQRIAQYAQNLEKERALTSLYMAHTRYLESFEKRRTYEKAAQLAAENYAIVNNRYLNGLALITEMLDASNMKLNAELQVVNANLHTVYHQFKLLRELGKDMISD